MILSKTLQKQGQLMSVATKVGIQINAKLGGEIWAVQIPVCLFVFSLFNNNKLFY
jgi:aubergine-like protein